MSNEDINDGSSGVVAVTAAQAVGETVPEVKAAQIKLVRKAADGETSHGDEIDGLMARLQTRDPDGYRYAQTVKSYIEKAKGDIRRNDLADLQRRLLLALQNAPAFAQVDFNLTWSTILALVAQNRKEGQAFHEANIFRLMHDHELFTLDERKRYTRLLNLVLHTCSPVARQTAVTHINFADTLRSDFSDEAASRITSFYSA